MKRFLALFFLVFLSPLAGAATNSTYSVVEGVSLDISLVNQDPYPAEPGGYVDLLFKVENQGNKKAENVVLELAPEYPFSLDSGVSAARELGTVESLQNGERAFLIKYKARVDKDAIDGENKIGVSYRYGSGGVTYSKKFDIEISDPKTEFEVVMQDSSEDSVTFAIVNTGKNTAYSLIIRIPEQESYRITGASANVIGNLDAGDYTLASFQVNSGALNVTDIPFRQRDFVQENVTRETIRETGPRNVLVELSYTDELGIRRTTQKEVRVELAGTGVTGAVTRMSGESSGTGGNGFLYIGTGVAGIIAIAVLFRIWHKKKKPK